MTRRGKIVQIDSTYGLLVEHVKRTAEGLTTEVKYGDAAGNPTEIRDWRIANEWPTGVHLTRGALLRSSPSHHRLARHLDSKSGSAMKRPMSRAYLVVALLGSLSVACGGAVLRQPPAPDRPVPASEPREHVRAMVDLAPATGCEEAFDLTMYANRSIELIEWDDNIGACDGRKIRIRYLSRQTREQDVLDAARKHAIRVERASDK